ncbi:hypothetical protein [Selenomonas ruminantium]|nr:hypothetical protein [Selenomonas ruminantium]
MLIEEYFENICHNHPVPKEKFSQWDVIKLEAINNSTFPPRK